MQAIDSRSAKSLMLNRVRQGLVLLLCLLMVSCTWSQPRSPDILDIRLYQNWQLEPGDNIAGYVVTGGLGDISIALKGNFVYAPFDGRTQFDQRRCLIFSSGEVPAYLFRLCGLDQPKLGSVKQGDALGKGDSLEFATLRKQANGTWAIVEPSKSMLERTLKRL